MSKYLFLSKRLGFRNFQPSDIDEFTMLNADSEVMKYFPTKMTQEQSQNFMDRIITHFEKHAFTYFAVELLDREEFIGFIGFFHQDYISPFTPAIDIGWRLKQKYWGIGLAQEGAMECFKYAQVNSLFNGVIAVCPEVNVGSGNVMKRIGMEKVGTFHHPSLKDYPTLESCVCYKLNW